MFQPTSSRKQKLFPVQSQHIQAYKALRPGYLVRNNTEIKTV